MEAFQILKKAPLAGVCLALTLCGNAHAAVDVQFVDPAHYTDDGKPYAIPSEDPERIRHELAAILQQAGVQCLPADQTVSIQVTDVRLAGTLDYYHSIHLFPSYRVMRDAGWPELDLDYQWTDANGQRLGTGHERVADLNYLRHAAFLTSVETKSLPYERYMLQRWFRDRFCSKP